MRLWDVATGQEKSILTGHRYDVEAVTFSPDGATLASGSRDGTVRVWDVDTGQQKHRLINEKYPDRLSNPWVVSVVFSPDGLTLASANRDTTVRVWDVETGQEKHTLTQHTGRALSVAFSPDGMTLASAGQDSTVRGMGRGNGAGKTHPHTTYPLGVFGGVFAGWGDAGKRQPGQYRTGVGRGHRTGEGVSSQDIRPASDRLRIHRME